MLRLTLEIVPYGDESRTRPIGMMHIGLQAVTHGNMGQYRVYCYAADGELTTEFQVLNHPRNWGAWELIRRAVEAHEMPDKQE